MKNFCSAILLVMLAVGQCFSQQKIRGIYDSERKIFVEYNSAMGIESPSTYSVEGFVNGQAVVKRRTKINSYNVEEKYGIIDTAGNIIVPIDSDKIEKLNGKRGDIVSLRDTSGFKLFQLGKGFLITDPDIFPGERIDFSIFYQNENYVLFREKNLFGLFHIPSKKIVLPAIADDHYVHFPDLNNNKIFPITNVKEDLFYVHSQDTFRVYNFQTGFQGKAYRSIRSMGTKTFELIDWKQNKIFTNNIETLEALSDSSVVDGFMGYFIVKKAGKFGLTDENFNVISDAQYDDIFFVGHDALAVKKGGSWAFMTYDGKETTGFEFFDIEKTHDKVVEDIKFVTLLDTTKFNLYRTDYKFPYGNKTQDLIDVLRAMDLLKNTKRLYPTLYRKKQIVFIVAHHLTGAAYTTDGTITSVYDEMYFIPGLTEITYLEKDKKFGHVGLDIRYQGCFYDIDNVYYNYGNHYFELKSGKIVSSERKYNSLTKSWQDTLEVHGKIEDHILYIYQHYPK